MPTEADHFRVDFRQPLDGRPSSTKTSLALRAWCCLLKGRQGEPAGSSSAESQPNPSVDLSSRGRLAYHDGARVYDVSVRWVPLGPTITGEDFVVISRLMGSQIAPHYGDLPPPRSSATCKIQDRSCVRIFESYSQDYGWVSDAILCTSRASDGSVFSFAGSTNSPILLPAFAMFRGAGGPVVCRPKEQPRLPR